MSSSDSFIKTILKYFSFLIRRACSTSPSLNPTHTKCPFETLKFLLTLLDFPSTTFASIHIYDHEPFRELGNSYLLAGGSEGIVASQANSIHDDGRSYIRFENITFRRTKASTKARGSVSLHIIIFEAVDRNDIGGSAYGGQREICCSSDLAKMRVCKQWEIIRRPFATNINWAVILDVQFKGRSKTASLNSQKVSITKTGMYNLFFVACEPKLKGIVMSGKTAWKNPYAYLPSRMAPLMSGKTAWKNPYVCLNIIWFFQYVRFWDDVLQLQHCIITVIALGLFEMILWYFEYVNFNNTGMRPIVLTTWVVTVGAIKKSISRLLILSVSMGYGVVRPTLGGLTSKVLLLGITYFLASELLNITEYVGTINDVSGRARLLVLPDAFLNAFLILWIFTSLSRTLEQLQVSFPQIPIIFQQLYFPYFESLTILFSQYV
eukprot:XP_025983396.1 uncharacterized protein C26H5.07c [Glycine max]